LAINVKQEYTGEHAIRLQCGYLRINRGVRREAANQHAILREVIGALERQVVEALERPEKSVTLKNEQNTIVAQSTLVLWGIEDEKRYQQGNTLCYGSCLPLQKPLTGLTIFVSAPDQALPSSLFQSFF
jgi:hypothetical protein